MELMPAWKRWGYKEVLLKGTSSHGLCDFSS